MAGLEAAQPIPTTVEPPSPTFTSIAPEIRNRILDLVFYSFDTGTRIDLLQIYDECRYMYRGAYQRFWTESKFVLHRSSDKKVRRETRESLNAFKDEDITHIDDTMVALGRESMRRIQCGLWYRGSPTISSWGGLVIPQEELLADEAAGFKVRPVSRGSSYKWILSLRFDESDLEDLKTFAKTPPLTKGEI